MTRVKLWGKCGLSYDAGKTISAFLANMLHALVLLHSHIIEEKYKTLLFWDDPKIETVIDLLLYHHNWKPSYIRQRIFPMFSTIFVWKVSAKSIEDLLLHEQYEFHSIQRIRMKYGHNLYLVKWMMVGLPSSTNINLTPIKIDPLEDEVLEGNEVIDVLGDEEDVLQIVQDGGYCFLLTGENMDLVKAAFPEEVENFLIEKELKQLKSKRNSSGGSGDGKRKLVWWNPA